MGRKPDGSPHYAERSADTQAELLTKLSTAGPPEAGITVSQWAARWFPTLQHRPRTLMDYRNSFDKHIGPTIGHLVLSSVTPFDVEAAAARWDLSPASARKVVSHLSALFAAACRADLSPRNPAQDAHKPRPAKAEVDPFTPEELLRIIRASDHRPLHILALLASTGLRIGEALALDVPDLDFVAGTVAVSKTAYYAKGLQIGPPKSPHSVRTIRIPAAAVVSLCSAPGRRESGPLFVTVAPNRLSERTAGYQWRKLCAELGLRYRNLHHLRHSVATQMCEAGVPVTAIAKYLGDRVETIVRTYLHAGSKTDPADTMDRIFGAVKGL